MPLTLLEAPTLSTGQRLTRDEFITQWEAMPDLKFAELIGGTVFLRHPTSDDHGEAVEPLQGWLFTYRSKTRGCKSSPDVSWYMGDDMPQPDCSLRILPEYGGQSSSMMRNGRRYPVGAPELGVEGSVSSRKYDLGLKKELYLKAGMKELLVVSPEAKSVVWFKLRGGKYVELKAKDGILRSEVFPGLWLDVEAVLNDDVTRLIEVLNEGLASPEHAAFAAALAAKKK